MSKLVHTRLESGRRQAIWLMVPSLLIVFATVVLLPWLLDTRRMLDNVYWEGQLLFAVISLCIAACGVPFIILRLFRRVPYLCHLGWFVVVSGYLAMTVYLVQSHIEFYGKLIFGALGVGCLLIAIRGLVADFRDTGSFK